MQSDLFFGVPAAKSFKDVPTFVDRYLINFISDIIPGLLNTYLLYVTCHRLDHAGLRDQWRTALHLDFNWFDGAAAISLAEAAQAANVCGSVRVVFFDALDVLGASSFHLLHIQRERLLIK